MGMGTWASGVSAFPKLDMYMNSTGGAFRIYTGTSIDSTITDAAAAVSLGNVASSFNVPVTFYQQTTYSQKIRSGFSANTGRVFLEYTTGGGNSYAVTGVNVPFNNANVRVDNAGNALTGWRWYSGTYDSAKTDATVGMMYLNNALMVNGGTTNASAALVINGTDKGVLPPRLTTAQRNAIASPAAHLLLSNTNSLSLDRYINSTWTSVYSSSARAATDANYSVPADATLVTLIELASANRTVTLPAAATYPGKTIVVKNSNSSGSFTWSFTGTSVKDRTDATFTAIANDAVYTLVSDGTNWVITSIYQ